MDFMDLMNSSPVLQRFCMNILGRPMNHEHYWDGLPLVSILGMTTWWVTWNGLSLMPSFGNDNLGWVATGVNFRNDNLGWVAT
eukprot:558614-Amphidinium_carterae.1